MPSAPKTLYALEAHDAATGLYSDPARRRFVMLERRSLVEGEVVKGEFASYVVTWGQPEAIASEHLSEPRSDRCARYNARVAAGAQRKAA